LIDGWRFQGRIQGSGMVYEIRAGMCYKNIPMISRREFGANFFRVLAGAVIATSPALRWVEAQTGVPVGDLRRSLSPADGLIVVPEDQGFKGYQASYNLRTTLVPEIRVLPKTAKGIATTVQWASANNVRFATRGGGHCYEGFSQSLHLVIDNRLMNGFHRESDSSFSVGSGANLGSVYEALSGDGQVIPAGSCSMVGVAGHCLGGGYGLLARPMGLACDSLTSVEIVSADGKVLTASASENDDLFWALRGAGGGSFGAVSKFTFRSHKLKDVSTFSASWLLPVASAVKVFQLWQAWAPHAPNDITSTMKVSKDVTGNIKLHVVGQSSGSESALLKQVRSWTAKTTPTTPVKTRTRSFIDAANSFSGSAVYQSILMKGRSDYVKTPMAAEGIAALMNELKKFKSNWIVAICDAYGGKVAEIPMAATAFAHRDALYSIQYFSQWSSASLTETKLAMTRQVYKAMRPYVSGYAYVNYPDSELKDYATAYWGDNLPRLRQIKTKYDPADLFKHEQSVPLA
jgi:FAD/FMN-containing dehydrogenase